MLYDVNSAQQKIFAVSNCSICDNFCSKHLTCISYHQIHETILKKKKENAVATCESTSLPPQICRIAQLKLGFCPWDMSNLNCLCIPCVSQQPAAQFSLPLLCMLVLGKSEVVLNQSTSSRKLFFLLCFGIWQM